MLSLKNISLNIPIYNSQNRSIKKLITSKVGSLIKQKANKKCSVLALRSISCDFYEGDRVGLLGHNGSGKTTFLKVASGIYFPTAGKITKNCNVQPMFGQEQIVP